jgi:hypothetical protein
VPKSDDIHSAIGMVNAIDDTVGTHNNLANRGNIELRDDASQLGKLRETFRMANEELSECDRPLRRIQRTMSRRSWRAEGESAI